MTKEYKIISDTQCPLCAKYGRDKTKNHLMIFEDGSAYCNKTDIHSKYVEVAGSRNKDGTRNVLKVKKMAVSPVTSGKLFTAKIKDKLRGIPAYVYDTFCVRGIYDEETGAVEAVQFPLGRGCAKERRGLQDGGTKSYRVIRETHTTSTSLPAFGISRILDGKTNTKTLYITEGEFDALALYYSIVEKNKGTKWKDLEPAVISLPAGAGSVGSILEPGSSSRTVIDSFLNRTGGSITLCFDADSAGHNSISTFLRSMSWNQGIKVVAEVFMKSSGCKDINELLIKSGITGVNSMLYSAKVHIPSSILTVEDVKLQALQPPKIGRSFPFKTLNDLTYGIQPGTIYGFGGGVGIGKSAVAEEIIAHLVNNHQVAVGLFMLEEPPHVTLKKIAGKIAQKSFILPDRTFDHTTLQNTIEGLQNKIYFLNHQGSKGWDEVKEYIHWLATVKGVSYIFLDPLSAFIAHLETSNANDALNKMMSEVSSMVNSLNVTIFYFSHLNPPKTGKDHERGGHVLESQFTGSRAMIKWSQYIFGIERNKDPDNDEAARNRLVLTILKDRYHGKIGKVYMQYDPDTTVLREIAGFKDEGY